MPSTHLSWVSGFAHTVIDALIDRRNQAPFAPVALQYLHWEEQAMASDLDAHAKQAIGEQRRIRDEIARADRNPPPSQDGAYAE